MAHIRTHTPEDALRWKEIARTNPGRVARTLALTDTELTEEGDHIGATFPALAAVHEISEQQLLGAGAEIKAWATLVDAGIADALCKNACQMVEFFDALPVNEMPPGVLEKVKEETRAPYFKPLEILCNVSVKFQYPPTKTDRKVIDALRKHWSEMMDRIWNEPGATLRTEASHTLERVVLAQLLIRIIVTDPTFISILYEPSDLTIQIIARHWKYAQNYDDTLLTISTLFVMLKPDHPRQVAYVRNNGLESLQPQIISKILVGIGPTALSSKAQQAKALVSTFVEHFGRAAGRIASLEFDFLEAIVFASLDDRSDSTTAKAVLKATPLWNVMFRLMKKSAKPAPENDQATGFSSRGPETEEKYRSNVIAAVLNISASTLQIASFRYRTECEPLVRIWANENLFGALEETIELLVKMSGMTMKLSMLATGIDNTVSAGSPSLRRLFRTQFPRWRIVGTLLRHDVERQQITGPPSMPADAMSSPDSGFWDHGAWQAFYTLQINCLDATACGKRGCENIGTVACRCQIVKYCSEACKTKDEKNHQRVCGHMGILENLRLRELSVRS